MSLSDADTLWKMFQTWFKNFSLGTANFSIKNKSPGQLRMHFRLLQRRVGNLNTLSVVTEHKLSLSTGESLRTSVVEIPLREISWHFWSAQNLPVPLLSWISKDILTLQFIHSPSDIRCLQQWYSNFSFCFLTRSNWQLQAYHMP
jgi:hypothetical protein